MSADLKREIQLEIAHVLLIDIVGYSQLLINEQRDVLNRLNRLVRSTNQFRASEAAGKLDRLPTGDGMVLVFSDSPEAPVQCALEISEELRGSAPLPMRMGIHSGPVSRVMDVNDRVNVAGSGINVGQRVMSCGDAGHILLSKRAADDLAEYRQWQPYIHEIGECEVKHGIKIGLVNFYSDNVGNPELPRFCKEFAERSGSKPAPGRVRSRTQTLVLAGTALAGLVLFALAIYLVWTQSDVISQREGGLAGGNKVIPEKSIAVLPFQNLSDDKQNAYFADGVQDEILTNLAHVADLKVISRTSVLQYKNSAQRNLREIAKTLGVSHILEGTVQRVGGRVRVNAQLIDARADNYIWAERYDRDLADVFAIENELAEKIVGQLKSKLSAKEKAAIEEEPTRDLAAYDLYVQAKKLIEDSVINAPQAESLTEAIRLLDEAIQRDPAFALAYYQLAHAHDQLYFSGTDHSPARLAMADAAIQSLARLRPNSGEAHLALAKHFYWGYFDYDRARAELDLAKKTLPNDPLPFLLAGYIDRRQSRWDESTKNLERAVQLDPQNPGVLQQMSRSYERLRRYADAERTLDHAIALAPKDPATRASRAAIEIDWHGDPRPLASVIETILAENPRAAENIAEQWLYLAECQRDFDAAQRALVALPVDGCHKETIPFPRAWCEGRVAQIRGDKRAARAAFTKARDEAAELVREQPNYAEAHCALGMAEAALGHKEEAIREGRRAVELLPVTKDSIAGALLVEYLAVIYASTGEKDLAFKQLDVVARMPSYVSYGDLRLHPYFDSLRGDPRFDKIVASLAPK